MNKLNQSDLMTKALEIAGDNFATSQASKRQHQAIPTKPPKAFRGNNPYQTFHLSSLNMIVHVLDSLLWHNIGTLLGQGILNVGMFKTVEGAHSHPVKPIVKPREELTHIDYSSYRVPEQVKTDHLFTSVDSMFSQLIIKHNNEVITASDLPSLIEKAWHNFIEVQTYAFNKCWNVTIAHNGSVIAPVRYSELDPNAGDLSDVKKQFIKDMAIKDSGYFFGSCVKLNASPETKEDEFMVLPVTKLADEKPSDNGRLYNLYDIDTSEYALGIGIKVHDEKPEDAISIKTVVDKINTIIDNGNNLDRSIDFVEGFLDNEAVLKDVWWTDSNGKTLSIEQVVERILVKD